MTTSDLAKKMKLRPGSEVAIINALEGYLHVLSPLPDTVRISDNLDGEYDWVQIFARNKAQLDETAPQTIAALKPDSLLWVSFPKGASKVQTDLTRDQGWEVLQDADLKWVNLVSVDDRWSAFGLRPYKPGETRQQRR